YDIKLHRRITFSVKLSLERKITLSHITDYR
ncbi:MAG: hypothetical protein ACI9KM_002593, partial [Rubritalea sp.]